MKCFYIFTIFFCLISFIVAAPAKGKKVKGKEVKGKGRAISPPGQPASRPNAPTPKDDSSVPLPGRTDTYTDKERKIVTLFYGDDNMAEHMGHLQRNQAEFPHNRDPMSLASDKEHVNNRNKALDKILKPGNHPVSRQGRVRDEKMIAVLKNPHHKTSTTVEYLPAYESNKEGGIVRGLKMAIQKVRGKAQLRPNPGWLVLHPDQQRGHEAPARLNSETRKDGKVWSGGGKNDHLDGLPVGQPGLKFAAGGNLRPGRVLPAGHIWKPVTGVSTSASHTGAPDHLKGAEQRHPPRPQDHDHFMAQLQGKDEAKHKDAASTPPKTAGKKRPTNLEEFNKIFGPAETSDGGRAKEAPARMQTDPPTKVRTSQQPSQLSSARTMSHQAGGSGSKPGPSNSNSKPGPSNPKPAPPNLKKPLATKP